MPEPAPETVNYPIDTVTLEALRFQFRQRIGAHVAAHLTQRNVRDFLTQDIVVGFETSILAETLPPLTLDDVEDFTVPRFATWFDHYLAAHWDRWWLWTLRYFGLFTRQPRFVDEPLRHRTTVAVRTRWTYPRSNTVLPGRDFGHVVLKSEAWRDRGSVEW